ncbi:MAG: methyltransferase domain-containing protein [Candidatus Nealsonbacteria bacterium]|nr:methyltransferase domain-containing protein [Candidatus Nealsonbacteria bacterium]
MFKHKLQKTALGEWLIKNLTREDLKRFLKENRSEKRTLAIDCDDALSSLDFFPNKVWVGEKQMKGKIDKIVDYYNLPFQDKEFEIVVCTGLLEHVKEPYKLIQEIKRVLKPGGKIILSASFVFSLHNVPGHYFYFTPYGIKYLLRDWSEVNVKSSCGSMKTLAILLQRICYQSDMFLPVKIFLYLTAKIIPYLQFFIKEEYGDIRKKTKVDSVLGSNVQVVAFK